MEDASVKKNFLYNAVFQVVVLMFPLITTPYVSRVLGSENIGKYSYASAMVTYFTLIAALGTKTYGQRIVAYHRDDKQEMSRVFWNTFIFGCISSFVSLCGYIIYVMYFEGPNPINIVISISILNVAFDINWFLQGIENFKNIVIRNLIVRLVCLAGIFVFVRSEGDTWKYVLIVMVAQAMGNLSIWRLIPKYISFVKGINPFEGLKDIITFFLPTIAVQVYTILDKSMIQWITGSDHSNGCYEQSERIARLALSVVTSVGVVILPRVANLFQKDNMDVAKKYVYKAFRVVWMLAIPMMLGLIAVSSIFIPLFLGPGFTDAIPMLSVFSGLILVVSLSYVAGISYLVPTKQQNVYTISVTIAAVLNVVVNFILIPKFGAFGAAVSSLLAETSNAVIQIAYCVIKKQLDAKKIFLPGWKYLIAGSIMMCVVLFMKRIFCEGILALFVLVAVGSIIYVGILLLLKDSLFYDTIKKIKRKLVRK